MHCNMRRSLRARRPPPSPKGRLAGYSDHHPSLPSSTGSTTTDGTSGSSGHWYVDAARALAETKSDVYGDIVAFNNAHPEEYVCCLHTAATFAVLNPPDCADIRLTWSMYMPLRRSRECGPFQCVSCFLLKTNKQTCALRISLLLICLPNLSHHPQK